MAIKYILSIVSTMRTADFKNTPHNGNKRAIETAEKRNYLVSAILSCNGWLLENTKLDSGLVTRIKEERKNKEETKTETRF